MPEQTPRGNWVTGILPLTSSTACCLFLPICLLVMLAASPGLAYTITYHSRYEIPQGTQYKGTTIGGLSGIYYDRGRDLYYAIADADQQGGQRFYTFKIELDGLRITNVRPIDVTQLKSPNGEPLPPADTEGIVKAENNDVWIVSEGLSTHGQEGPWLRRFAIDSGRQVDSIPTPEALIPIYKAQSTTNQTAKPSQIAGAELNRSLESLTISANKRTIYIAPEKGLLQDRDSSLIRIHRFQYDGKNWQLQAVKPYRIYSSLLFNSLSELLLLQDGKLLTLERRVMNFPMGTGGFSFSIYLVDFDEPEVQNLKGQGRAAFHQSRNLKKKLLYNPRKHGLGNIDNIEGMCLGPVVDGQQTLVLVSDDNLKATQETQFLLFTLAD